MGQLNKLIEQMLRYLPETRFADVEKVLVAYEFKQVRVTGSHHHFRHPDGRHITVPTVGGRMVKVEYIKQVLQMLHLD